MPRHPGTPRTSSIAFKKSSRTGAHQKSCQVWLSICHMWHGFQASAGAICKVRRYKEGCYLAAEGARTSEERVSQARRGVSRRTAQEANLPLDADFVRCSKRYIRCLTPAQNTGVSASPTHAHTHTQSMPTASPKLSSSATVTSQVTSTVALPQPLIEGGCSEVDPSIWARSGLDLSSM